VRFAAQPCKDSKDCKTFVHLQERSEGQQQNKHKTNTKKQTTRKTGKGRFSTKNITNNEIV